MEIFLLVLLAFAWLPALLAFIYTKHGNSKTLPPGPTPWPILGNLLQLGTLPHITLCKWSSKYGEIMSIKYGLKNVVVASSPKIAEEFLKTHDRSFASRPPLASGKYTTFDFKDMLWAPYGPHWKLARKVYLTELFTPKRLDSFQHIRINQRRAFLSRLFDQRGTLLVLKDHLTRYTLSSISRVVFGHDYFSGFKESASNATFSDFHELLEEWIVLNGVLNIGDWVPFLQRFDLQGYVKRMKNLHKKFDRFYDFVIADHKERMGKDKDFVPRDMIDVLLMLTRDDTDPEVKITIDEVKGLIHDLMPGGTDTSAVTTEWAVHELLRHPEALKKLREELDRVIGRERWVEEDDYPNMPYLEAIIKEILRLHPLAPLLPPHLALEDCNVAGYDIPKGTIVLVNTYTIGRDPSVWENPHDFAPERFLEGGEIDATGKDFRLLPFGSGRRRCPGYSLGLRLVRTTIGNLFHGFDVRLPEGFKTEDICMVERYGLTTCPEVPTSLILQPRLPIHLYHSV